MPSPFPSPEGSSGRVSRSRRAATGAAALGGAGLRRRAAWTSGCRTSTGSRCAGELRAGSDVPIIVVTARGDEIDRVVGLELGADDYIVKPFGFRELVARIRAVTRRAQAATRGPRAAHGRARSRSIAARTRSRWRARCSRSRRRSSICSGSSPRSRARSARRRRSSRRCGTRTGTGRPRPSTCTSPRCARSSATPRGSRLCAASGSGWSSVGDLRPSRRASVAIRPSCAGVCSSATCRSRSSCCSSSRSRSASRTRSRSAGG